jgi:hypothetical protein
MMISLKVTCVILIRVDQSLSYKISSVQLKFKMLKEKSQGIEECKLHVVMYNFWFSFMFGKLLCTKRERTIQKI